MAADQSRDDNWLGEAHDSGDAAKCLPAIDATLGLRLLASSPDCVKLVDKRGKLRFVNANGLELLGIDHFHTLENKPWHELWPEQSQQIVCAAVREAVTGRVARFVGMCPTASGEPKWWDVAVSPVHNSVGALVWVLVVSRDITLRKRTDIALASSEQRFRALADNMAQLAWMADETGSIFWFNQRWFDYTGTTFEQMAGWGWKSTNHPDHVERVVNKIRRCFETGRIWEDTFPLRAADGSFRWFLSRARPIKDECGKVTLWCGTNTDVTEQRNASQRLRQLARLIELSHEPILVRNPQSGIVLWNRGCEVLYGYSQLEAVGKNTHDLLHSSHAGSSVDIEKELESNGTWSGELKRVTKDGSEVWVDCRKELIRWSDDSVILETNRDITQTRKSAQVRDLLIGEVNHRVKNTLAIVQSLVSQTARNAHDIDGFVSAITGRLQSLARTHTVLADTSWLGTQLRLLITSQLDVIGELQSRFDLVGDDIIIPPQAALQLSSILHELATNAVKHGALLNSNGKISITWSMTGRKPPSLEIVWKEFGGPKVNIPNARGFGLSLIERSASLPHIHTRVSFDESGLQCTIQLQLTEPVTSAPEYFDLGKRSLSSAH